MSTKYLELSINGLTVRFNQFFSGLLPRTDATVDTDAVAYTASGNVVITGPNHEVFALWTVDAPCAVEQYETLKLIKLESDYRRRINSSPHILVYDTTQYHQERAPRTRATVPGTAIKTVGSYLLYYPQYYAVMGSLEWRQFGRGYAVAFTLQETERVPA